LPELRALQALTSIHPERRRYESSTGSERHFGLRCLLFCLFGDKASAGTSIKAPSGTVSYRTIIKNRFPSG
jgi:hypothetical protein